MLGLHDIPGLHYLQVSIPAAAAADATAILAGVRMPFKCTVKTVHFIPAAAITGADTNSANYNVQKVVDTTATEIANKDFASGTNATALVETRIGGAALDVSLAAGDRVVLQREKVGTGLATPAGTLVVAIVGA